jgi:hypothetical protein
MGVVMLGFCCTVLGVLSCGAGLAVLDLRGGGRSILLHGAEAGPGELGDGICGFALQNTNYQLVLSQWALVCTSVHWMTIYSC